MAELRHFQPRLDEPGIQDGPSSASDNDPSVSGTADNDKTPFLPGTASSGLQTASDMAAKALPPSPSPSPSPAATAHDLELATGRPTSRLQGVVGEDEEEEGEDEEEEEEYEAEGKDNCWSRFVGRVQGRVGAFLSDNSAVLWRVLYAVLLVLYLAYFIAALVYRFGDEGSLRLLVVTLLVAVYLVFRLLEPLVHPGNIACCNTTGVCDNIARLAAKFRFPGVLAVVVSLCAVIYILAAVAPHRPGNLTSLGGVAVLVLLMYIFSYNPTKVAWRPVVWGILLQFSFAVLILRTRWGYATFSYLGDRVTDFLAYTDAGSKFVFGDLYTNHFVAFKVLPVVVFFSTFVTTLYYLGFMQFIIRNVGRCLAFCLDTSPAESLSVAANIFISMVEAPLLIRPFLQDMTRSELHAVMTGGFATIAGSVMAAYILYEVPANHLLSASVMSAPAELAVSKLFYPETERVRNRADKVYDLQRGPERNVIEAASNGASQTVKLVANVAVNLIGFIALLDLVNATLVWFGDRVGFHDPQFTFQLLCSYAFYPLSFLMGVDADDCLAVGELIGTKTFLNEFYAYTELSKYIKNRAVLDSYLQQNRTQGVQPADLWNRTQQGIYLLETGQFLEKGVMTARSVVIATYALCGFSNLSSMGIMLGALGSLAPSRRSDLAGMVFRAMIAGNVACFMTACIAGLLSEE